jgi:hypothetical protein
MVFPEVIQVALIVPYTGVNVMNPPKHKGLDSGYSYQKCNKIFHIASFLPKENPIGDDGGDIKKVPIIQVGAPYL